MQLKKTQAFQKAMQELIEHQRLLKNPSELPKFLEQLPEKPKTLNRNKTPMRRLSNKNNDSSLEDVYEFSDAIKESFSDTNISTGETSGKKRGRRSKGVVSPTVMKKKMIKKPKLDINASSTKSKYINMFNRKAKTIIG